MKINVSTKTEYVPEWNGNKDDANPIVVEHLNPTLALYNSLIPAPAVKMLLDADGKMDGGETEVVLDNRKIAQKMITKIRNLELVIDNEPLVIKTASDLFGPNVPAALSGLVDEVGSYLQGILSKKAFDEKK